MIDIIKETIKWVSKQANEKRTKVGTITPKISFKQLTDIYYKSFIVQGLTDKMAIWINSWLNTKDENLLQVLENIDHLFLTRNLILNWNAFFEVIRNNKWEVVELLPILTNTMQIMADWDWYRQQVGTQVVYFNAFTPIKERKEKIQLWEQSGAKEDELVNTGKGCWYNPNLNEVYHFKNTSLETKYYWASFFEAVIDQLVLLAWIDKYHVKGFEDWLIKLKLLFSKDWTGFMDKDKEVLKEFIRRKAKGLEKAYSVAILDKEIWELDLEHDLDTQAFLEYRKQLMQSVCIALNVPYDMLLNQNSNKASSQVSKEIFNQQVIKPFQEKLLRDFKKIFWETYKIEDLKYKSVDTKDQKEEMLVYTGYKKSWIMTPNEVREKLGLEPIEWWDELQTSNQPVWDLLKEEQNNFYETLNKIENDIWQDLYWENKKGE